MGRRDDRRGNVHGKNVRIRSDGGQLAGEPSPFAHFPHTGLVITGLFQMNGSPRESVGRPTERMITRALADDEGLRRAGPSRAGDRGSDLVASRVQY